MPNCSKRSILRFRPHNTAIKKKKKVLIASFGKKKNKPPPECSLFSCLIEWFGGGEGAPGAKASTGAYRWWQLQHR